MSDQSAMKKILFVQQRAPYGSLFGQEGLDAILAGSAFTACSVYFSGDGLFQITRHQNPASIGLKDYAVSYEALADYGVERLYALDSDLAARGLVADDFLVPVTVLSADDVALEFENHDVIMSF